MSHRLLEESVNENSYEDSFDSKDNDSERSRSSSARRSRTPEPPKKFGVFTRSETSLSPENDHRRDNPKHFHKTHYDSDEDKRLRKRFDGSPDELHKKSTRAIESKHSRFDRYGDEMEDIDDRFESKSSRLRKYERDSGKADLKLDLRPSAPKFESKFENDRDLHTRKTKHIDVFDDNKHYSHNKLKLHDYEKRSRSPSLRSGSSLSLEDSSRSPRTRQLTSKFDRKFNVDDFKLDKPRAKSHIDDYATLGSKPRFGSPRPAPTSVLKRSSFGTTNKFAADTLERRPPSITITKENEFNTKEQLKERSFNKFGADKFDRLIMQRQLNKKPNVEIVDSDGSSLHSSRSISNTNRLTTINESNKGYEPARSSYNQPRYKPIASSFGNKLRLDL